VNLPKIIKSGCLEILNKALVKELITEENLLNSKV